MSVGAGSIIKLRRVTSKNVWNISTFNINNRIFTKTLFENMFSKFWKGIENKFTDHNHMFILFKIKYVNGEFATIGTLQRINNSDKDWYINWIINNMEFKSEYYNETQIDQFIISYGFNQGKITDKKDIKNKLALNYQIYKNNKLVISFNPLDFGKVISKTILDSSEILYILQSKDNLIIKILTSENTNIIEYFKDGDRVIKFEDLKLSDNSFIRSLDSKKYYFENNIQILFTKDIKTKFISKQSKSKKLINNFITLDIETYIKDNVLIPYCISIKDDKTINSFFITDYKNSADMIISALKSILIRKYNGYNIYIHNMAKFDIIFLFKYLIEIGSVTPIIHNGRIISINLNYGKNLEYRIQFKDSYLILITSLAKLSKGFMVDTLKSVFPYLFVNENNLDYIGPVPEFKYFDNSKISLTEYNNYSSKFIDNWNLKSETIKYCEIDVISLYQVIFKFSELIFSLFGKNIHHYPTLPSLAFAIFRSTFLEDDLIPQLNGKIADDIRQGYTGGAVDMYIPKGKKIWVYDVNALYPYVMSKFDMPVGKPIYFEGDITVIEPDAFGFFYCEIIAPNNIKHPIIQTHVKTKGGLRTMAPVGTWNGMLFSEELKNALKYGYKFNILWGYKFERKNIFKSYVDNLYNMRLNYPKSDPLNYIAKILLNSLYGRFGMNDNFAEIHIIHKDFINDFENKFLDLIIDKTVLDDYILIQTKPLEIIENDESTHNVSIGIAAAITAYARIHMSQFKNNPNFILYYSDTDSIYVDKPLPDHLVDSKILGKLKLEYIIKKGIFLSPKVYYLETEDGKVIYKVKGLSHDIELTKNDFESLLYKDAFLEKNQSKWFRNLSEGQINILEQIYTLKVTDNKRKLIYKNSKLIGTKPYKIDKTKDIS
jgi:DNA polymerase type B, organellar and viral